MKSHKKRWKDSGNPRYRLNTDEAKIINDYRRLKLEAEAEGLNPNDIHSGWIKNKKASLYFKNPNFNKKTMEPKISVVKNADLIIIHATPVRVLVRRE